MSNFLSNLVEVSGNENASSVDKGLVSDIRGFIDTGSYTLNALLSGSLYGGIPITRSRLWLVSRRLVKLFLFQHFENLPCRQS